MDENVTAEQWYRYWQNRFIQAMGIFMFAIFAVWDDLIVLMEGSFGIKLAIGIIGLGLLVYGMRRERDFIRELKAEKRNTTKANAMRKSWDGQFLRTLPPYVICGLTVAVALYFHRHMPPDFGIREAGAVILPGIAIGLLVQTFAYLAFIRPPTSTRSATDVRAPTFGSEQNSDG